MNDELLKTMGIALATLLMRHAVASGHADRDEAEHIISAAFERSLSDVCKRDGGATSPVGKLLASTVWALDMIEETIETPTGQ